MSVATPERNEQLLVSGKRQEAATGETFNVLNPANNLVIARVAKGGAEDVDRAVKAARASAFDEGPWPRMSPYERGRIIQKMAEHHSRARRRDRDA